MKRVGNRPTNQVGLACQGIWGYSRAFHFLPFCLYCVEMASPRVDLPGGYILLEGYPSVPDYLGLRSISGLSPKTPSQAAAVATGSWYGCYITFKDDPRPVGMGRIIGDGGW